MAIPNIPANRGSATFRKAVSSAYTIVGSDQYLAVSGTTTVTLPSAANGAVGQQFKIANVGTNTVTVSPAGTDTISGGSSLSLSTHTSVTLISDGVSNWEQ